MPLHQLALPLPPSYSYNKHENFSFFTARSEYGNENSNEVSSLYSEQRLVEYVDDLCAFVKRTRLIQNHPEDYFEYEEQLLRYHCNEPKLSKQNEQEMEEEQEQQLQSEITQRVCDHDQVELELKSDHFDFTGVTVGDLKYTMRLCNEFGPLITDNTFSNMQLLVRDGPPLPEPSETSSSSSPSSLSMTCEMVKDNKMLSEVDDTVNQYTELREFFEETRRLQLHRTPVDARHVASLTLSPMWSSSQQVLQENNTQKEEEEERESKCSTVYKSDEQKKKIMSLVLNRGMSVKKRHEVQIMESAIANLVHCINKNSHMYNVNKANTMINIGEGKGYVSRAVALCDALQVIGLDCNPNHREGAVQRIEQLLEDSLATRHYTIFNVNNNNKTSKLNNGGSKNRSNKIVNLLYEPRGKMYSIACSVDDNVDWHELLSPCVQICKDKSMPQTESCINSNSINVKNMGKYSNNDKIHNKENTITAKEKIEREDEDIVEEWLRKKQFDETSASLKKVADICIINSNSNSVMTLESAHVIRGTRVIIAAIRNNVKLAEIDFSSNYVNNEEIITSQYTLCNNDDDSQGYYTITVIGYDEASHRHRVVYDHIPAIHYISLYKPKEESYELEIKWELQQECKSESAECLHSSLCNANRNNISSNNSCISKDEKAEGVTHACIVHTLPFVSSIHYPVAVPSLQNCILVGLHTCGNLGSDICRLYTQCDARGLLLVSCCWHALTTRGFPLSRALQCRSMTLSQLSLQLATQPADMWATADPVGHRSSAKLLFFRSLLKLLWRKMSKAWKQCSTSGANELTNLAHSSSCAFFSHHSNDNIIQKSANHDNCDYDSYNKQKTDVCNAKNCCCCCCALPAVPHLEPAFLRRMAKSKDTITFGEFVHEVCTEYIYPIPCPLDVRARDILENTNSCKCTNNTERKSTAHDNYWQTTCSLCKDKHISFIREYMCSKIVNELGDRFMATAFSGFLGFTVLRMWMCHLLESLLLLDRVLFLHEAFVEQSKCHTTLSLVPLFDGKLSPRSFAIMARRIEVN